MIPQILNLAKVDAVYAAYLNELRKSSFSGEIEESYSARLLCATDNSVYQVMPQAVIFPKSEEDVSIALQIGAKEAFSQVIFTPRGGGTGTNGQSLNRGIVIDLSRFMCQVLHFDAAAREVTVQPGVIKDELNEFLKPHGLFFSPELSTSNRATVGGMISNDAAGQGSLKYGRTSTHIKSLRAVLLDGTRAWFGPVSGEELQRLCNEPGLLGSIYRGAYELLRGCQDKVREIFPKLNRFMTGYDLDHAYDEQTNTLNLARLICGAEGTLAVVTEAVLDLTEVPRYRALLNIKYHDFDSALRHANDLIAAGAFSVETVDSKVLGLAKKDPIWLQVKDYLNDDGSVDIAGINIVEFCGQDAEHERELLHSFYHSVQQRAARGEGGIIGAELTETAEGIAAVYGMRKKAVGLLGSAAGAKKLVAFTEDTVVPPQHLADYIKKFRALMDGLQVEYGMFGHVDTGLMHVRPALDLTQEEDRQKLIAISNGVVELCREFGGQMWGEHGRGYRSCFGELFFGELYDTARKIKALFDAGNRLNPGKICVPYGSQDTLVPLDGLMRGDLDKTIPISVRQSFEGALACNGNGQCFSYQKSALMCPSYRYTRDRVRSPKGYSGLMREWLRLMAERGFNPDAEEAGLFTSHRNPLRFIKRLANTLQGADDFNHEYLRQIKTCLACKSCKTQCPAHVNAADLNSRFLFFYYSRYLRPSMDLLTLNAEAVLPWLAKIPSLSNAILKSALSRLIFKKCFAFVDLPLFSPVPLARALKKEGFALMSVRKALAQKPDVVIVCDAFTAGYDAEGLVNLGRTARALGYKVGYLRPYVNGKLMVIRGDRRRFVHYASKQAARLERLAAAGIDLLGFDPALTICYGDEYRQLLGSRRGSFEVQLPEHWLCQALQSSRSQLALQQRLSGRTVKLDDPYYLFCHCTEQALLPESVQRWQQVFAALQVPVVPVRTACCGMAGLFGHMLQNQEESRRVYEQNWQDKIRAHDFAHILVTGFSCRSQVTRMEGRRPAHPVDLLASVLEKS